MVQESDMPLDEFPSTKDLVGNLLLFQFTDESIQIFEIVAQYSTVCQLVLLPDTTDCFPCFGLFITRLLYCQDPFFFTMGLERWRMSEGVDSHSP